MNEAFALNMRGVSGYLVTTSGRSLEQIDVDAVMEVEVSNITAGHSVEENYRPTLIIEGMVSRLSGSFGEAIPEVALDEGIAVVLDYALSDEEIGKLAKKGFFHKDFPFKLSADNSIRVPHRMPCMVFNGAEVPIIVVGQEEGHITCNVDMLSDTDVLDCMEDHITPPKQDAPFSISLFEQEAEARATQTEKKAVQDDAGQETPEASKEELHRQAMAEEIIEGMTRDVHAGDALPEWVDDAGIGRETGEGFGDEPFLEEGSEPEETASASKGLPDISAFEDDGEDYASAMGI